jgi:hypothetical protein
MERESSGVTLHKIEFWFLFAALLKKGPQSFREVGIVVSLQMVKQVYKDSVTCPNLQAVRDSGRDDPYV